MMDSSNKNLRGTFDVVLNGGSPWGFTLQGGSEFRSKLIISKITHGGKAHQVGKLNVGDEVLTVNGIECTSRSEAIELVRCARDTLRLRIRRRTSETGHQNGQIETQPGTISKPLPNFYATARELADSDFYSTYNVDPATYKRMTHERPFSYHAHTHSDSLSGSSEDLLESYRNEVKRNRPTHGMTSSNNTKLSKSSTDISNDRVSPVAVKALSGVSLQETPVTTGGQISPGKIMKVTVRTATISGPSSPSEANSNLSAPRNEIERERKTKSLPKTKSGSGFDRKFDLQEKVGQDNWVERWLRDNPKDKFQTSFPDTFQKNFAVARSKFENQGAVEQNRPSSVIEENFVNQSDNEFPRSRSFSGRTVFGVRGMERQPASDVSVSHAGAPAPPRRFSSSTLLQDRNTLPNNSGSTHSPSPSVPVEMKVSSVVGQPVEITLQRDLAHRFGGSTSSLDSVGTMDSNVSRSRQGPAPPPRRSQSKLLSSFRSKDKRFTSKYLAGIQGSTLDKPIKESFVEPSEEAVNLTEPKHAASKSWPFQSDPDPSSAGEVERQSWHAEPTVSRTRRPQRYSYEPQGSDKIYAEGPRFSSSVRIRALSTGGDVRPHQKIYRSVSQEDTEKNRIQADLHEEKTPTPLQTGRIEDTQILKQLLNDSSLPDRMHNKSPSVKLRVETFENKSDDMEPDLHGSSRSFSYHDKEKKFRTSDQRNSSSSVNIQKQRSSPKENVLNRSQEWSSSRQDTHTQRHWEPSSTLERKREVSAQRKLGISSSSSEEPVSGKFGKVDDSATRDTEHKKDNLSALTVQEEKENVFSSNDNLQRYEWQKPVNSFPSRGRHSVGSYNIVGSEINLNSTNQFDIKSGRRRVTIQPLVRPIPVHGANCTPNTSVQSRVVEKPHAIVETNDHSSVKALPTSDDAVQSNSLPLVSEEMVMSSSSALTEKELDLEQQLRQLDSPEIKTLEKKQSSEVMDNSLPLPPPPEICDDSQWDNDDSLPPPPPELILNTSEDNIPLPSPPGDVFPKSGKENFKFEKSENELIEGNDFEGEGNHEDENSVFEENKKNLAFSSANKYDTSFDSVLEKQKYSSNVTSSETDLPVNVSYESKNMSLGTSSELEEIRLSNHSDEYKNLISPNEDYSCDSREQSHSSTNSDSPSNERHHLSDTTHQDRGKSSTPSPLIITSTPTKELQEERDLDTNNRSGDVSSPFSLGSDTSTPSSSRPNSMLSPKLEQLDKEKDHLVESMKSKINELKTQQEELADEIKANEELGEKITKVVESYTTSSEFSKYQLFTGELNKIIGLLLSLTQRMHRYELMLQDLDMSEESDRIQRDVLLEKIDKVKNQYEEACLIKQFNDKRGEVVSKFLEQYCSEEEFADFQYYIDMKTQLALMHAEIRDKVKMGTDRLNALSQTAIDWNIMSFS